MARKLENWLDAYMEFMAPTEPPTQFHRWTALTIISGALQRKCRLDWGMLKFYPNIYTVLVAPAGRARKSTAMGFGKGLLRGLGVSMASEATTREAFIKTLSESTTVSGEGTKIYTHSSTVVYSSELVSFLGFQNQQLLSDITDWYDCEDQWTNRTIKHDSQVIEGVYVTMLGGTTPSLIKDALPVAAVGGGLTSRMFLIYEPRIKHRQLIPHVTAEQKRTWKHIVHDLNEIHKLFGQFKPTRAFAEKWAMWYGNLSEECPHWLDPPRFGAYWSRKPNHIMKLCMLVSAAESDSMIVTPTHFDKALEMLETAEKGMSKVFATAGENRQREVMENMLQHFIARSKDEGRITKGEIYGTFMRDATQADLDSILSVYEEMNVIRMKVSASMDASSTTIEYIGGNNER